jgi:hypothetical protein
LAFNSTDFNQSRDTISIVDSPGTPSVSRLFGAIPHDFRDKAREQYLSEKYGEQNGSKGKSNVHVYKTAPESPTTLPVEEKDSDA